MTQVNPMVLLFAVAVALVVATACSSMIGLWLNARRTRKALEAIAAGATAEVLGRKYERSLGGKYCSVCGTSRVNRCGCET